LKGSVELVQRRAIQLLSTLHRPSVDLHRERRIRPATLLADRDRVVADDVPQARKRPAEAVGRYALAERRGSGSMASAR
jgi:hypothetical protein